MEAVRGVRGRKRNGPEARKPPRPGRTGSGVERVAERARKPGGEGAKDQAGTFDPGMGALRGVDVAGEGKADTSCRFRQGEGLAGCGALGGIDPGAGETGLGGAEQRSTRRSRTQCLVRCMPVASQAGNRVTWNHFFWGGALPQWRATHSRQVLSISTPAMTCAARAPKQTSSRSHSQLRTGTAATCRSQNTMVAAKSTNSEE